MTTITTMTAAPFTGRDPRPLAPRVMRIACDIGGTLIQNGEVDEELLCALVALHLAGHEVFLVSGASDKRDEKIIRDTAERLQLGAEIVGENFFTIHGKGSWDCQQKPINLLIDNIFLTSAHECAWPPQEYCDAQILPQQKEFPVFVAAVLANPKQDIRALVAALVPGSTFSSFEKEM